MEKSPYDFVAIGDIVTDAFIRLSVAHVQDCVDHNNREICMAFGDKIPFESVDVIAAVGNSPNAAASASRLGLKTALITDIGDDHHGGECIATLRKNGIATEYVHTHKNMATNYHYVLWYNDERTILIKHQEYPYSWSEIAPPRWAYISSLAENSYPYHQELIGYFKRHPEVNVAFQPGTFQMKLGIEKLRDLYRLSKIFFCNVEEAKRILKINEDIDVKDLLSEMRMLGPKTVVITDGPRGAYAYDGVDAWFMPTYPDPKPPFERTGAGDSFASTVTSALALGKPLEEALMWGPVNSMSVVQQVGAQRGLLTREKLEYFLANAPSDYKPIRM